MPDILPVRMQDKLRYCKSAVRKQEVIKAYLPRTPYEQCGVFSLDKNPKDGGKENISVNNPYVTRQNIQ